MNQEEFESLKGLHSEANGKIPKVKMPWFKERYRLIVQKLHPDRNKKCLPNGKRTLA